MKQISYNIDTVEQLEISLAELESEENYKKAKSVLIQIYEFNLNTAEIEKYILCIKERMPHACIAGITSNIHICNGKIENKSVMMTVSLFVESEVIIKEFNCDDISEANAGIELSQFIKNTPNVSGIEILSTSSAINLTKFIHQIEYNNINHPIFGAGAGLDRIKSDTDVVVFSERIYKNGIIAVVFTGKNLHIKVDYCLGWIPLGKEMEITETKGPMCISKIDGVPAASIYEKYLHVLPDKDFIYNTCAFPITMIRHNKLITRASYNYDSDGAIHFTADVRKGEKIRLSFGNPQHVLKETAELNRRMRGFNPQALFMYGCVNRKMLFGDSIQNEIDVFKGTAQSVNGFYGNLEVIKNGKNGFIFNTSMIAAGMREGPEEEHLKEEHLKEDNISEEKEIKHGRVPFIDRLLTLIQATSDELKESNDMLRKLVVTDDLTGIYNRRKIEDIFSYEISKRSNNCLISVIMLDIDDFKGINDTLGHDYGDNVLKKVAEVLKNNIRNSDSIGRWGGEEFMMILPKTSSAEAVVVAERMRKAVENISLDDVKNITVSIGVTKATQGEHIESVYKRVDTALYNAKANGKNRIETL
ncbi:MAG: diguanylate cyclase [Clostridium sp.]|nr:diguanylate cyclase [Clostridium sp.]